MTCPAQVSGEAGGSCPCTLRPSDKLCSRRGRAGGASAGSSGSRPPSPAVLCPQAGGDGGGHEQHAAESGGAGAHGRGPAHRRAAPVSDVCPSLWRGTRGSAAAPLKAGGGAADGGRGSVSCGFPCTGAPALLPARPRAPAPLSAARRGRRKRRRKRGGGSRRCRGGK